MHELSLAQDMLAIVEAAARKHGATRVASVRLDLGDGRHGHHLTSGDHPRAREDKDEEEDEEEDE